MGIIVIVIFGALVLSALFMLSTFFFRRPLREAPPGPPDNVADRMRFRSSAATDMAWEHLNVRLDYSVASLESVDTLLDAIRGGKEMGMDPVGPVGAYVGEVLVRSREGVSWGDGEREAVLQEMGRVMNPFEWVRERLAGGASVAERARA